MKEYEITGRVKVKKAGSNPVIVSKHNGITEQEALKKFKKRYSNADIIDWQVTKFIFDI